MSSAANNGVGGSGSGGSSGFGGALNAGGGAQGASLHATAVAVGAAHSCAILEDATVACWGAGARGQLGDGVSGKDYHRAVPAVVAGLEGVTLLRAGGETTCAVTGGGVWCWGDGGFGQLGDGTSGDGYASSTPVPVSDLSHVVDLSMSGINACAALADGTVKCWGRNAPEQWLGFDSPDCGPYTVQGDGGPMLEAFPCESRPKQVPGAMGAVAVASGGEHNCLRDQLGGASCWGADNFGQLGDGVSGLDAHSATPMQVQGIGGVRHLAAGSSHTCGVVGDELKLRCWGDNSFGQLGIGSDALDSYKTTPADVNGFDGIVDLDVASRTSCAVLADQTVACWGDTATVLPVSPTPHGALVPTAVPGVAGVIEVHTGGSHVCARRADLSVVCWGLDDRGQLGSGMTGFADFSMQNVAPVPSPPGGPG